MRKHKIFVLGEILYDCFPNGVKVPGGAPFNVAWNLQALGDEPLFLSAVGADAKGEALKTLASDWGLSIEGIQIRDDVPTSTVEVTLDSGIPSYSIIEDTAMDRISISSPLAASEDSILYHGSLAARSDLTYESLREIRSHWSGKVFLDINIRNPYFDAQRFAPLLSGVDYLKINDEEFEELSGQKFDFSKSDSLLGRFAEQHGLSNIILTCGKKGAFWHAKDGIHLHGEAAKNVTVKDTVGAGDAFASVCLVGISRNWEVQEILNEASQFAGRVCGLQGATTKERSFYKLARS